MTLNFDLANVTAVEFGIGLESGDEYEFVCVPVDSDVQRVLQDMAIKSWQIMNQYDDGPRAYEPSEKHGSIEYLLLPLTHGWASSLANLHNAIQLPIDSKVLEEPEEIYSYFCRLKDNKKRTLTGLRRASQFKGILKSRNRLIQLIDDTIQVVADNVFKLDSDFDLLVDCEQIHILRPSGFEFAAKLQRAIKDSVHRNVTEIQQDLPFVDFDSIDQYARKHTRAARYLASINSQAESKNIDKSLLVNLCNQTNVAIEEKDGRINNQDGHELAFLEVLDRRRYEINLIKDQSEHFRASSRRKIDK